jgi:hypothetical protein
VASPTLELKKNGRSTPALERGLWGESLTKGCKFLDSTFILSMQNTISTQFFKHPFLF